MPLVVKITYPQENENTLHHNASSVYYGKSLKDPIKNARKQWKNEKTTYSVCFVGRNTFESAINVTE